MSYTQSLNHRDGLNCPAVAEFFANNKTRRNKNTYKGLLGEYNGKDFTVYFTIHQLSLFNDKDYVGKTHLRRGHIVEKHYIEFADGRTQTYYQDFGAHPKFANLDQPGFPDATREALQNLQGVHSWHLFAKESGSMNIAVFPRKEYTIAGVTYTHPLEYYVTSKNGWNNEYAQAGNAALQKVLAQVGKTSTQLCDYLHNHNHYTVVFELMKYNEHVYEDRGEDLYVHMVDGVKSRELGDFLHGYLPVVEHVGIYGSAADALARWEADNQECNHELEGYVLVAEFLHDQVELKVKLKFWRYLVLREFREAIGRRVCPTLEELDNKFKLWDVPEKYYYYKQLVVTWWWWIKSSKCTPEQKASLANGKFVAIRDQWLQEREVVFYEPTTRWIPGTPEHHFHMRGCLILSAQKECDQLRSDVASTQPVMVYFVLVGVQCIGKSTIREEIVDRCGGFARSQDECGGVRGNLITEIDSWAKTCKTPGLYSTVIDRCNFDWSQRRTIYNDLAKVQNIGFIHCVNMDWRTIDQNPQKALEVLFERFIKREGHLSFSKEVCGSIKGLEILANSMKGYIKSPDGGSFPEWASSIKNPKWTSYKMYTEKPTKTRFVYGGIATPSELRHTTKPGWVYYGSHITLVYGKDKDPLPEGQPVEVTIVGKYTTNEIAGYLVQVPDYPELKHITIAAKEGVSPAKSNEAIEKMFGCSPGSANIGQEVDGIEWVESYKINGWYGNYYN